jgi:superfamily II DNA/RNA helicase
VKSVAKKGGTALTPIKIEAMLVVLCQCFVMVVIQTGIGKTAGYAVYIKVLV